MIQPDIEGWTTGVVVQPDGVTINTNVNALGVVWWSRLMNDGETLSDVCRDFYQRFPFADMGTNVASCVATQYDFVGGLLQQRTFNLSTTDLTLFGEE